MNVRSGVFLIAAVSLSSCASADIGPSSGSESPAAIQLAKNGTQHVYWTLYSSCKYPLVQFAKVPLKRTSKAKNYYCTKQNGLNGYSSGLYIDSLERTWLIYSGVGGGDPGSVAEFILPLASKLAPNYVFVLSGTDNPRHLTFDASGDLWVVSRDNSSVLEYTGPFNKSGTLSPAITLTNGIDTPSGIAFDTGGNLYVSNFASTGTNSIAVFSAPISASSKPYFLDGLNTPGGLIFDKSGNLYASSNGGSSSAIVRYDSDDLSSGDTPSIVDSTGISDIYEAEFAFSASRDLYFANCSTFGAVYVYRTGRQPFSSSLAPSIDYTNSQIDSAACVWGIAFRSDQ
jgi:hypothetical protein